MKLYIEHENKMYEFVKNNADVNACGKCALRDGVCHEIHYNFYGVCVDLEIAMEQIAEGAQENNYIFREVKKDEVLC